MITTSQKQKLQKARRSLAASSDRQAKRQARGLSAFLNGASYREADKTAGYAKTSSGKNTERLVKRIIAAKG